MLLSSDFLQKQEIIKILVVPGKISEPNNDQMKPKIATAPHSATMVIFLDLI